MMNMIRVAVFSALISVPLAAAAISITILDQPEPPAPIVQQPQIDEERLASLIAAKIADTENARIAAERAPHKKADCAFWGKRMEGCS